MKKLFKMIRQENLEEVKRIIEKKPELVNCIATPPPKKDAGQSPLQVAIKASTPEIIDYLIEHGADVNFMDAPMDIEGYSCHAPVIQDAIIRTMDSLCYQAFETSDSGLSVVEELLRRGADPNKRGSNGMDAMERAVLRAEMILNNQIYAECWEKAEQQLTGLLDLLLAHGADFEAWAEHEQIPMQGVWAKNNRERYLDEFVPREEDVEERFFSQAQGEEIVRVYKKDFDWSARMRAFMRKYCAERGLL